MRDVQLSVDFVHGTPYPLQVITDMGRICYQSEPRELCSCQFDTPPKPSKCADCGSYGVSVRDTEAFTHMLIKRKHFSVLEHVSVGLKLTMDRGLTHEAVRHRLASFSQESTRFCNYLKATFGSEIQVVEPPWMKPASHGIWYDQMLSAEKAYFALLEVGEPPEFARSVLPTCLKAEIGLTANAREWRHILGMRLVGEAGRPHPQMVLVMRKAAVRLLQWCPTLFEDIVVGSGVSCLSENP